MYGLKKFPGIHVHIICVKDKVEKTFFIQKYTHQLMHLSIYLSIYNLVFLENKNKKISNFNPNKCFLHLKLCNFEIVQQIFIEFLRFYVEFAHNEWRLNIVLSVEHANSIYIFFLFPCSADVFFAFLFTSQFFFFCKATGMWQTWKFY